MKLPGEVVFINGKHYMTMNGGGSLEKLPPMPWYRVLWCYLRGRRGKLHLEDIRRLAGKEEK